MSRSKSHLRARAVFLLALALYTYMVAPAMAAGLVLSGPDDVSGASPAARAVSTADSESQKSAADTGGSASPTSVSDSSAASTLPAEENVKALAQKPPQSNKKPLLVPPPPPAKGLSPDSLPPPSPDPVPEDSPHAHSLDAPPSAPGVDESYVLGPGDYLTILDYTSGDNGQPIAQSSVPILPDGTISVHPVGVVKAAGLTLREFTQLVNRMSLAYLRKPDIEITVTRTRPNSVYILGEVSKPGLYTNEAPALSDVSNVVAGAATLTVVSALQKAGGLKQTADVRNIRISRLGASEQKKVNLWQLIAEGDVSQDIPLISGDVIFVPKGGADFDPENLGLAADPHRRIRILGAVRAPGLVEMLPEDDVFSVIAKAGGFTGTATRGWVLLSRLNRDGTLTTRRISIAQAIKDPDATARFHIKPGDLIMVHDSLLKKGAFAAYTISLYTISAMWLVVWSNIMSKAFFPQNSGSGSGAGVVIPATGTPSTMAGTGSSP